MYTFIVFTIFINDKIIYFDFDNWFSSGKTNNDIKFKSPHTNEDFNY